jgi:hypothetical protein
MYFSCMWWLINVFRDGMSQLPRPETRRKWMLSKVQFFSDMHLQIYITTQEVRCRFLFIKSYSTLTKPSRMKGQRRVKDTSVVNQIRNVYWHILSTSKWYLMILVMLLFEKCKPPTQTTNRSKYEPASPINAYQYIIKELRSPKAVSTQNMAFCYFTGDPPGAWMKRVSDCDVRMGAFLQRHTKKSPVKLWLRPLKTDISLGKTPWGPPTAHRWWRLNSSRNWRSTITSSHRATLWGVQWNKNGCWNWSIFMTFTLW